MRILKLLLGAAVLCAAINCNAQTYGTIHQNPLGGDDTIYFYDADGNYSFGTIRQNPLGGDSTVYIHDADGNYSFGTIHSNPLGGDDTIYIYTP